MNLRELAESLGLSQTTVSRALNGYPEVREQTRARVLAAARAANYTPNTRARRLATGRAMTIGHVIPLSGRTEMVNPIFADFLAGAGEVYAREGYDMLLSVVGADGAEDGGAVLVVHHHRRTRTLTAQNAYQVAAHVAGALVAVGRVLAHCLENDRIQLARNVGIDLRRRLRIFTNMLVRHGDR